MITRVIPGLIYGSIFYICILQKNIIFLNLLLTFFLLQLNIEFYHITKKSQSILLTILIPIIYIGIPILLIQYIKLHFGYNYLLFIVFMTWINDVSAFIIGKTIGRHKISHISKNKTIEGFLGSLLVCVVFCYYIQQELHIKLNINTIFLGALISISCNAGDLIESLIKRKFNKKDSGKIMIGHGGMLDRLDSLLLSATVFYIILLLNGS